MIFSTSSRQNQVHSSSLFPVQICDLFLFTSMIILFFHLYCTYFYLSYTLNFSLHMLFYVIYVLSCVSLYTLCPLYLIVVCHIAVFLCVEEASVIKTVNLILIKIMNVPNPLGKEQICENNSACGLQFSFQHSSFSFRNIIYK